MSSFVFLDLYWKVIDLFSVVDDDYTQQEVRQTECRLFVRAHPKKSNSCSIALKFRMMLKH